MRPQRQIGEYITATDPAAGQLAQSYAVVPGGPQNMSPQNVMSINGGPNTYKFPYGDMALVGDPRTAQVMPHGRSQLPANKVPGQKLNQGADLIPPTPPGMQPQLEANHMGLDAQRRGLVASPMGMIGQQATPAPGGANPMSSQQAPNTMPLNAPTPDQYMQAKMGGGNRSAQGMRT